MNTKTIITLVITVTILGGLFITLKPDSKTEEADTHAEPTASASVAPSPSSNTFSFLVLGGRVSAPEKFSVTQGSEVTIRVTADTADEIHLHGYDLSKPTAPGQPVELKFVAATAGRFEIELEKSGTPLGNLEVLPK